MLVRYPLFLLLLVWKAAASPLGPDDVSNKFIDEMDGKYFPIFLQTIDMIHQKKFERLNDFYSEELMKLTRISEPARRFDIASWKPPDSLYSHFWLDPDNTADYRVTFPIDWGADPRTNQSWVLAFQSLYWLKPYLARAEDFNDDTARLIVFRVIADWLGSNPSWPAKHKHVYSDHATADRLLVFYRALRVYQKWNRYDPEFLSLLLAGILNHVALLSTGEVYGFYNHGIIVDRSLLLATKDFHEFLPRGEIQKLARARVIPLFEASYTGDGVHKEHSPCYGLWVTQWMIQFADYLDDEGLIDRAVLYFVNLLRPDATFPPFGDCSPGTSLESSGDYWESIMSKYPQLQYVLSRGRSGIPPRKTVSVYEQGGVGIFRSSWSLNPRDVVYAVIQSNYFSDIHYHQDETSLCLSAFGSEYIVDPGFYNYEDEPLALYARSAAAHNVLMVDDKNFDPSLDNTGLSGIRRDTVNADSLGNWKAIVELTHPHYRRLGVTISREFCKIDDSSFVVDDFVAADSTHNYTQLFHFAPGTAINYSHARKAFEVLPAGGKSVLWLRSTFNEFDTVSGSMNPVQGWYFSGFGVAVPAPVLRLHKRGMSIEFKTFMQVSRSRNLPRWEKLQRSSEEASHVLELKPQRVLHHTSVGSPWVYTRKKEK